MNTLLLFLTPGLLSATVIAACFAAYWYKRARHYKKAGEIATLATMILLHGDGPCDNPDCPLEDEEDTK